MKSASVMSADLWMTPKGLYVLDQYADALHLDIVSSLSEELRFWSMIKIGCFKDLWIKSGSVTQVTLWPGRR